MRHVSRLRGSDPLGLLGEPEPFAHKLFKAGLSGVGRLMSSLQRQVGLFAIPLRFRSMPIEHARTKAVPGTSRIVAALCRWTLDFFRQPSPGSRDPALPFRGGVPRFSDDAVRWIRGRATDGRVARRSLL